MKANLKNILVPVDFEEPSINALNYAIDIAKHIKGNIHLLHVINASDFITRHFQSGDEVVKLTEKAKDNLNQLASQYSKEHDINITTRLERGKPHKKILQISEEMNARMVIIGDNDYPTRENENLGSTIYQVVIKSKSPVITVKGPKRYIKGKILVPLDLTRESRKQVYSAIALGMHYNSTIHLVSTLIGGVNMVKSRIFKKIKHVQRTIEENNIPCHYRLYDRSDVPPYKRVLEYADEIDADLILIMTHEEGYTHDNYIGAFAHHIINHSDVPVLSLTNAASEIGTEDLMKTVFDPLGIFSMEKEKIKYPEKTIK